MIRRKGLLIEPDEQQKELLRNMDHRDEDRLNEVQHKDVIKAAGKAGLSLVEVALLGKSKFYESLADSAHEVCI